MTEKSNKRKRSMNDKVESTVVLRGVINANWQKFLSNNLMAENKVEKPVEEAKKDTYTGTFRRTRKKKQQNSSIENNLKTLTINKNNESIMKLQGDVVDIKNNNNKNKLTKFIAMDCEMVGIGYNGDDHMLARVSLVNKFGDCIYDKFVKAREEVIDYRTEVSGVRKEDIMNGEEFTIVQKEVAEIIKGRILVGHSLKHDLSVLFLSHPKRNIRDTSKYKPFRKITKGSTPSLKRLAKEVLGIEIQRGEHSSIEDARAVMQLYCSVANKWEAMLSGKRGYSKEETNYMLEAQLKTDAVKGLLEGKDEFDLVIVEASADPAMVLSHLYKAPMILFSSLGLSSYTAKLTGTLYHPIFYPTHANQKFLNLTWTERLVELFTGYTVNKAYEDQDVYNDAMLQRLLGDRAVTIAELRKRVDMVFANIHPVWDCNRPVPPNVVYLGGFHMDEPKPLSKDLERYLNSSKHGVIYVSCGTVVNLELMHPGKLQAILNVFAKLPYDILMKWDSEMENRPSNVKISKWLPQTGVLNHPNVKLFITQAGLQSTDEAIVAGVPLIGMPVFGDQLYNAEQYLNHKIGLKLNLDTMTESDLNGAIHKIMENRDWYRNNLKILRTAMYDQPQTAMERAVFWTEYIIRNGGKMLRSPAANMSLFEYYQVDLIIYCLVFLSTIFVIIFYILYFIYRILFKTVKKVKVN